MIQGRGEVVRLALEEALVDYIDVARNSTGKEDNRSAVIDILQNSTLKNPPFAPPFLVDKDIMIAQAAAILQYLAPKIGLIGESHAEQIFAHQIQLTVTDFLMEVHDTHHPIASALYYEDQVEESKKRSANFIKLRIPKYLDYFEKIITNNKSKSGLLIGETLTYPDLSLFQIVEGLHYAFPKAFAKIADNYTNTLALRDAVAARPNTSAYLASDRRIDFNTMGVFRHYPELDGWTTIILVVRLNFSGVLLEIQYQLKLSLRKFYLRFINV
jgi:glutathione S-transferase